MMKRLGREVRRVPFHPHREIDRVAGNSSPAPQPNERWNGLEQLEPRLLLSATVQLDPTGDAYFTGDSGSDTVILRENLQDGSLEYSFDGIDFSRDLDPETPGEQTVLAAGAEATVDLGEGDDQLEIQDSAGRDRFEINGDHAKLGEADRLHVKHHNTEKLALKGLDGDDVFDVVAMAEAQVEIDGGEGRDTLTGPDAAAAWAITGADEGTLNGATEPLAAEPVPAAAVQFTSVESLAGGSSDDVFAFADGATVGGTIDGGGGFNSLDYSAYTTDVTVALDLASGAGAATGTAAIANIQHVVFGQGSGNLLILDKLDLSHLASAGDDSSLLLFSPPLAGDADAAATTFSTTSMTALRLTETAGAESAVETTLITIDIDDTGSETSPPGDDESGEKIEIPYVMLARGPPAGSESTADTASEPATGDSARLALWLPEDASVTLESIVTDVNVALVAVALSTRTRQDRSRAKAKVQQAVATLLDGLAAEPDDLLSQSTDILPLTAKVIAPATLAGDLLLRLIEAMDGQVLIAAAEDLTPTVRIDTLVDSSVPPAGDDGVLRIVDTGVITSRGPPAVGFTAEPLTLVDGLIAPLAVDSSHPDLSGTTPTETDQDLLATDLTDEALAPLAAEAIARWTALLPAAYGDIDLSDLAFQVADLPDGVLGQVTGTTILIDRDASGLGWFVDPTPADDAEFTWTGDPASLAALDGSDAAGRMDLLSVLMHEIGHVIGFDHRGSGELMSETLSVGWRLQPDADLLAETPDHAFASLVMALAQAQGEPEQLNDVIDQILERFNTADPPPDGTSYDQNDPTFGPLLELVNVGALAADPSIPDLQLTNVRLEFSSLQWNGTAWDGQVVVEAEYGVLYPGRLQDAGGSEAGEQRLGRWHPGHLHPHRRSPRHRRRRHGHDPELDERDLRRCRARRHRRPVRRGGQRHDDHGGLHGRRPGGDVGRRQRSGPGRRRLRRARR
jgi:hypothetical protein